MVGGLWSFQWPIDVSRLMCGMGPRLDITVEWAGPGLCACPIGAPRVCSVHLCHATLRNRNVSNNGTQRRGERRGQNLHTWTQKDLLAAVKGLKRQVWACKQQCDAICCPKKTTKGALNKSCGLINCTVLLLQNTYINPHFPSFSFTSTKCPNYYFNGVTRCIRSRQA